MNLLYKLSILGAVSLLPFYAMAADAPKPASPAAAPVNPAAEHPVGAPRAAANNFWDKVDTNHDGSLSKEEWMADSEKRFKEIDANNDGKITKEEMRVFTQKKRAEMQQMRAQQRGIPAQPVPAQQAQ